MKTKERMEANGIVLINIFILYLHVWYKKKAIAKKCFEKKECIKFHHFRAACFVFYTLPLLFMLRHTLLKYVI